jgi:segregation and condensation protein B
MSLKAKLEAVIYAAEEPVTLNQLAALFAADALEWKAAQEAAAAEQAAEVAGAALASESLPFLAEGLEYLGLADTPDVYAGNRTEPGHAAEGATEPEVTAGSVTPTPDAPQSDNTPAPAGEIVSIDQDAAYPSIVVKEVAPPESLEATATPADTEAESRRLARQRDREVKAVLKQLLDELIASYSADGRGVEIREIAGGYRMATKPQCHDAVRLFVKSLKPPMKLSLPALETLAVIAYKQPVTAPEVNEIRGVESAGVLGSLLARKLIATAGRKQVIGRPILYKTTREFLLRFGLNDVSELPSMEEFEKMAATELEMEPEVVEADKAEQDEAADSESADPDSGEPDLGSNSPSGEEPAAAAETVEVPDTIAQESAAEPPESQVLVKAPADAMTPITAGTESTRNLSEPASSDSHQTAEIEASHAEEIQKES